MNTKLKIIIAFIVTSIILTMLIPMKGVYRYNYSVAEKWMYEDLMADFDFQVLKTDEELKQDYDNFEKQFVPVYRLDRKITNEIFINLLKKFNISLEDVQHKTNVKLAENQYIGVDVYKTLKMIYDTGVLDNRQSEVLRLVKDGTISMTTTFELFNTRSALDSLNSHINKFTNRSEHIDVAKLVTQNIILDERLTAQLKDKERKDISISKSFMPKGGVIIKKGEFIDKEKIAILDSYKTEYQKLSVVNYTWYIVIGNFFYMSILMALNYFFLRYFRSEFSKKLGNVLFILFIYIMMMLLTRLVLSLDGLSLYMIPYAIIPLYVVTFYDIRQSIFEFVIALLICLYITPIPFELLFLNMTAGLAATFIVQNSYHRTRIFEATGVMLAVYIVGYVAFQFMHHETFTTINWIELCWFILNVGVMLALYQLVYIFERIFGFVTNITLFELCDTNRALLQELAQKAPGTFQHSIQVANLAEAAASKIGANPLLARTGALYHDIGKMENPVYFIENVSGEYNPHDKLEPLKSVEFIKQHVTDGLKLAKKFNLPSVISNFIVSHHGTSKIFYFYHAYITKYGEPLDDSLFLYSGPLPSTKEESICMMSDSIEAASRSMTIYTHESITGLVNKIIDNQISENQFDNAPLTLKEISQIKEVLVNKLLNIYHTRIVYPER